MDQNKLNYLLRRYIYGQLNEGEIQELKFLLRVSNDATVDAALSRIWDEYRQEKLHHRGSYQEEIAANLKQLLKPDKRVSFLPLFRKVAVAAVVALLATSTIWLYVDKKTIQQGISQEYRMQVDKGERASLTLPDGTKVYLNAESTLSYPASFGLGHRTVELSGEAYFEVKQNKKVPFIVHTPEVKVQVLGTTFNLLAYPDQEWFEASLVTGSIEVTPYHSSFAPVRLTPNQKARYNPETGELSVSQTDLYIETAWKRGDLIFRNESVEAILKQLELFYGVEFEVSGSYPEDVFTGSYHENDMNQVLKNLQLHYTFSYQKTGDRIHLRFE